MNECFVEVEHEREIRSATGLSPKMRWREVRGDRFIAWQRVGQRAKGFRIYEIQRRRAVIALEVLVG